MPRRTSFKFTGTLARLLVRVFFREVRVLGAEQIPPEGPLVYAVNHPNSLVDPLLIHGVLPRPPRFLAKHTLWDMAVLRPFLKLAGSIPVYRTQDRGARSSQNLESFEACYRALTEGAAIGIFPEGVSHSGTSLKPVKTGIVRIVLGAEERHGPLGVRIVPVGLTFDARNRFRSRVLITVGTPIGPVGEIPADRGALRRLRRAMTGEVEEALRKVTLNYGSAREKRLLERAGDLYSGTPASLPGRPGMPELFEVQRDLAVGYEVMKERCPERVGALARNVDAYDRMLRVTGFSDGQVLSSYPRGHVLAYAARMAVRLLFFLPVGAAGALLNYAPYKVTARIAKAHEGELQDPATYKIVGGLFVYPMVWALESTLAGFFLGWRLAPAFLLLSPPAAFIAMRFKEELEHFWHESSNFLRLHAHRRTWEELRKRRAALTAEIGALAGVYRDAVGGGEGAEAG